MTEVSPPPSDACGCDDLALQELDRLMSKAFGIVDGYLELNGIVSGAVGYDLFERLGLKDSPMAIVVNNLRIALIAAGHGSACLKAIYLALPGNAELRDWMKAHCPGQVALVSEADFEACRLSYDADRMDRRMRAIRRGLDTLAPGIHWSARARDMAQEMIARVEDMAGYKAVHDQLHGLQMMVLAEFIRVSAEAITPVERQRSMARQALELELAGQRIARTFDGRPKVELRDNLVRDLGKIRAMIATANLAERETSEGLAGMLRALLRQQMSLFDSRLVDASEQIPFEAFATLLENTQHPDVGRQGGQDPVLLANVALSLRNLEGRLVSRRVTHRSWQQIETAILNIEELLRGTGRDLEFNFHLANIGDELAKIAGQTSQPNLTEETYFQALLDSVKAGSIRSEAILSAFVDFRREARPRFESADIALLNDCDAVRELNAPLKALLGGSA